MELRRDLVTVFVGMLTLTGPCASGAIYYVATTGADSNPGTITAPFQTLQKGASTAVAGDTVIVRDGTYGHVNAVTGGDNSCCGSYPVWLYNSGTPAAPITIKAENKWGATLDCEMLCDAYINLYNSAYVVIQNFVITRGYKEAIHSNDAAHHVTIRGNRIEYIANRSTQTPLGLGGMYANSLNHDFLIDSNMFHDIGRTNTDITTLDHGLYFHSSNFTVTNNIFYNIAHGWKIQLADGANNTLIANNTFAFPNLTEDGQIMLWNSQSGLVIENNIFYNPHNYAIVRFTSSVSTCMLDRNLVYGASGLVASSTGCSVGATQVGANPMFVNPAAYDFHVQSGGAGVDAGANLSAVPLDIDGNSRPQGSSTDVGAYEFSAPAGPVISGVFGSSTVYNSAAINWFTDVPATSFVQYGPIGYSSATTENMTLITSHLVTLSNLTASTVYHYRVGSRNSAGNVTLSSDFTFATPAHTTNTPAPRQVTGPRSR